MYFTQKPPVKTDALGRVIKDLTPDNYQTRIGVAMTITELASNLSEDTIPTLFKFFVPTALSDVNEEVSLTFNQVKHF